ncbi:hypothetical protein PC118_g18858 [Phytophthora cactorum]|uniref:Kazal-like domain-containing protein n=2 Tax=Phytophthora cactorum TaxID=29920 RepID=A0A329RHP9_9STRA|nr:hypothetical protein PC118_g18858 [Phytophthora cactorum]RAW24157.1 hypothetical protein PC110_g19419 [Phytophthora cactorum]
MRVKMKSFVGLVAAAFANASVSAYIPGKVTGPVVDRPTDSASGSIETPTRAASSESASGSSSTELSADIDDMDCSGACMHVNAPIMDDDGTWYPNACEMRMAKCEKSGKKTPGAYATRSSTARARSTTRCPQTFRSVSEDDH